MTDQIDNDTPSVAPNERDALKTRAKQMGLKFAANIPTDKLREMVNEALIDGPKSADDETADGNVGESVAPTPKPETKGQMRARLRRDAGKLIRVRITCMDPNKKEHEGEIFSAGNSVVGSYTRFVPFNTEWHIPEILYKMIRDKQVQIFVNKKLPNGQTTRKGRIVKAYSVEVLPPLTQAELDKLARKQALANSVDNDDD